MLFQPDDVTMKTFWVSKEFINKNQNFNKICIKFSVLGSLYGLFYEANTEDHIMSKVLLPNDELARIWKIAVVG